jgi:ribosomal protein S18 acetylase RimI-like enzyme
VSIEITGAEGLAELAALERTAEAVFGRGDRRPGWFGRKLIREGVEAGLSSVAVEPSGAGPIAPAQVQGYALIGRAPSLGAVARGAGVGVLEAVRGRGLGRALLEHALARAGAAGCEAVEFLAEPTCVDWYIAQGFQVIAEQLTLLAYGTGEQPLERAATAPPRAAALWSWIPEAWERTPASERTFVEIDGARFWLTREGRAWLVHRCELDDPREPDRHVAALRRRFDRDTPLLLYPCPAASEWVAALSRAGFGAAQRSFVVQRRA